MATFFDGKVQVAHPDRHYIGGEWIPSSSTSRFDLISPTTEAVTGQVAAAGEVDVDRAVAAARDAFDQGPWPLMNPAERSEYITKLAERLRGRIEELAHAWTGQIGVAHGYAAVGYAMAVDFFEAQVKTAASFPWEEQRPTAYPDSIALVRQEPVGVVAAIVPWNAPFFSTAIKVAPALMAGCTVVLKPSPETPLEAYILAECAEAAGFPPGVLNVIAADRDASDYLVRRPGVDKVSFTGSTETGKRIAAVCADRVARVALELGGKSPAIVLEDADIDQVTDVMASSLSEVSGQVCVNMTRYLIPESLKDEFIASMVQKLEKITVGDPYAPETTMGPLATRRQIEKVEWFVQKGLEEGAQLATGGKRLPHAAGYYFEPTLFVDVDNMSTIAQEEIFGPVACVTTYRDIDDAIRLANESKFGLAGAIFTNDSSAAYRIATAVKAGSLAQNGLKPDFSIAHGGFKQSGIGREGGEEGLKSYLEMKTIVLDALPEAAAGASS
ncbi:aldehyde dehydrogenase [Streptomyces scopuliridis]|uniref:aldehyde dehydrogenase n=1 Tax=Streptomyces scopuliridis TaxID=452529 RepID=UPI00367CFC85